MLVTVSQHSQPRGSLKKAAVPTDFVPCRRRRRMFEPGELAEREELGSNILHLETPEIQPMRTTSATPCATTARGTAVRARREARNTRHFIRSPLLLAVGLRD